jgi:outer membrane lipoprotein-sorting protein
MRTLSLALAAILLVAPPVMAQRGAAAPALSAADRADIGRVEAYLATLDGVVAGFVQVGDDGGSASGTLYLSKPGRMRFAYDPPNQQFLVANGAQLTWVDPVARETTAVPLSATPLSVLVNATPKLDGDVTVTAVERGPGSLRVTLHQTDNPDRGRLTLVFTDRPMALNHWIIVDGQKRTTRVGITDMRLGQRIDTALFTFEDPRVRREY